MKKHVILDVGAFYFCTSVAYLFFGLFPIVPSSGIGTGISYNTIVWRVNALHSGSLIRYV